MLFRLQGLTDGNLSEIELQTAQSANSVSVILENMVNAPYKTAVYVSTSVFDSVFGLRLVGAVIGGLSIVLFYLLTRKLYGTYISVLAAAMFGSSSLLLHNARLATPNVMFLALIALIAVGFYLRFGKRKDIGWPLAAATVALSLYTPGMFIFVLLAGVWQFRHVKASFEQLKTPFVIASSVIFSLLIAPLVISLIREPSIWRDYLGLPETLMPLGEMARHAGTALASLFAISPEDPVRWLGRQPALDIFATTMFAYGAFRLAKQYRLGRLWLILGTFVLATAWIGATGQRGAVLILLPVVYLVVGIGTQNFINAWLKVFPLNPIAKTVGSILLLAAILLSINFQVYRYFVAWPHADATKGVFTKEYHQ